MEALGAMLGVSVVAWIGIAIAVAVLAPVAWLWMLIDAIVRNEADFPSRDTTEKIMWIVLMLVFQATAVLYFFIVWLPKRREQRAAYPSAPTAPAAPTAA